MENEPTTCKKCGAPLAGTVVHVFAESGHRLEKNKQKQRKQRVPVTPDGKIHWCRNSKPDYPDWDSKRWNAMRDAIIAKRGAKCEECGRTDIPLAIHHVNYQLAFDDEQGIVLLCTACHMRRHLHDGSIEVS